MPGESCPEPGTLLSQGVTDEERLREFVDQYVAASIKLSEYKFDAIGSLDKDENGKIIVGNAVDSPWYDPKGNVIFGGPYKSLQEKYLFELNGRLDCIRAGRMHRAGPLLPYLTFLDLHRQMSSSSVLANEETEFYIAHADSHAHNMMATPDKLTAIVDWEW